MKYSVKRSAQVVFTYALILLVSLFAACDRAPSAVTKSVDPGAIWEVTGTMLTGARFAILMRALCQRNGGTFVALPPRGAG